MSREYNTIEEARENRAQDLIFRSISKVWILLEKDSNCCF
jgi:hypothetical protein